MVALVKTLIDSLNLYLTRGPAFHGEGYMIKRKLVKFTEHKKVIGMSRKRNQSSLFSNEPTYLTIKLLRDPKPSILVPINVCFVKAQVLFLKNIYRVVYIADPTFGGI